jgi:choline dehydrogenase-like flavoprotein
MGTVSIYKGVRGTSASIFLSNPPANLTITPDALVDKVIFDGKRAVGVVTADGRQFRARCEVILSGGALNTPQTLLLSGIGPSSELRRHGIPTVHELPLVGQTLQDHAVGSVGIVIKRSPQVAMEATQQSPTPMGFFKADAIPRSAEYKALPAATRSFMERRTVPHFELAFVSRPLPSSLCLLEVSYSVFFS